MTQGFIFHRARLVVPVTRQHIDFGHRDCRDCAVSMAIRDAMDAQGFPEWGTELSTYAAFAEARGLVLYRHRYFHGGTAFARLPTELLPENLIRWTMDFDAWVDWQIEGGSRAAFERRTGTYPFKPHPETFTFNLSNLEPYEE